MKTPLHAASFPMSSEPYPPIGTDAQGDPEAFAERAISLPADLWKRVSLACGDHLPLKRKYDVVIDMHRLRDFGRSVATEGYLLF